MQIRSWTTRPTDSASLHCLSHFTKKRWMNVSTNEVNYIWKGLLIVGDKLEFCFLHVLCLQYRDCCFHGYRTSCSELDYKPYLQFIYSASHIDIHSFFPKGQNKDIHRPHNKYNELFSHFFSSQRGISS